MPGNVIVIKLVAQRQLCQLFTKTMYVHTYGTVRYGALNTYNNTYSYPDQMIIPIDNDDDDDNYDDELLLKK